MRPRCQGHTEADLIARDRAFLYDMMRRANPCDWVFLPPERVAPGPGPNGFNTADEVKAMASTRENFWVKYIRTRRVGDGRHSDVLNSRDEAATPCVQPTPLSNAAPRVLPTPPSSAPTLRRANSTLSATAGSRSRSLRFTTDSRVVRRLLDAEV